MVHIVDDFGRLRQAVAELPYARTLYKVDQTDGKAHLRVRIGSLAVDRWYDEKSSEFDEILDFLRKVDAIPVKEQRLDEVFFM